MNLEKLLWAVVFCLTVSGAAALATPIVILETTYTFTGSESTQTQRPFRDGVQSQWGVPRTQANPIAGTFPFSAFSMNVGLNPYLHVQFSEQTNTANVNVGAYQTSFVSSNLRTNWLGDAGLSTGIPSTSQSFFVTAAPNSVVILDAHCATPTCTGGQVQLLVTGYADPSEFGQSPVPEPSTAVLFAVGIGALALLHRRNTLRKRVQRI